MAPRVSISRAARLDATKGRRVLIVSGVPSHPPTAGNRERILQLATMLREIGWRPTLLFQDYEQGDLRMMRAWWGEDFHFLPYRRKSPAMLVKRLARRFRWLAWFVRKSRARKSALHEPAPIPLDHWYDPGIEPVIQRLLSNPAYEAVISQYVLLSRLLESLPRRILGIIDTHELFAIGRRPTMAIPWANLSLQDEIRGLRRADVVWAIQREDEEALRCELGSVPAVFTVGHAVPIRPLATEAAIASKQILLVASNHRFNLQGIQWFAREVYPLLAGTIQASQVIIAGSAGEALRDELPFRCLGRVPELTEHYRAARVVICPILDGTGLKIKAVEALGLGRPLVTTGPGATGLEPGAGTAYLRADSPAEFAAAVTKILTDDALCLELMAGAMRFMQNWNHAVRQAILTSLASFPVER